LEPINISDEEKAARFGTTRLFDRRPSVVQFINRKLAVRAGRTDGTRRPEPAARMYAVSRTGYEQGEADECQLSVVFL
jgi:hypothetical protein